MPASPASSAAAGFDRIARPYRWLEYLSFGPMLERVRFSRIPQFAGTRRALVLGDGDGRFLARLLASNPSLQAEVVDQSPAMLRLLEHRATAAGAGHRVHIHQTDARAFQPTGPYDLVITHFFLDCFTAAEVLTLAGKIRPHLSKDARWLISEFAIPPGIASLPAKGVVTALYAAFRIITGLRVRTLPDHAQALARSGLILKARRRFLAGLLVSELWEVKATEG